MDTHLHPVRLLLLRQLLLEAALCSSQLLGHRRLHPLRLGRPGLLQSGAGAERRLQPRPPSTL